MTAKKSAPRSRNGGLAKAPPIDLGALQQRLATTTRANVAAQRAFLRAEDTAAQAAKAEQQARAELASASRTVLA